MWINISHLNLGRNVRLSVLLNLDFNMSEKERISSGLDPAVEIHDEDGAHSQVEHVCQQQPGKSAVRQ